MASTLVLGILLAACAGKTSTRTDAPVGVTVSVVGQEAGATPSASTAAVSGTPAAAVSLTPAPGVAKDLATARRLESEGDLPNAAQVYIAIASSAGPDRGEAVIGAARDLLELEKPADARTLLEPFVTSATGRDVAARYLLARAYAALSLWSQSLQQYDLYIQSGRPAVAFAYLDRGSDLSNLDRPADAAASVQNGLSYSIAAASRRSFLLAVAQNLERAGSLNDAIRAYRALIDGSDLAGDKALALARIAAIKRGQGDSTYTTDLANLLSSYPATEQAQTELTAALARGEAIDPTVRGLIYYRHNDYTKAQPAFQAQVDASPNAAASALAYYYLGAIKENQDDEDTAKTYYARAAALDPASSIADDALWWQARILEANGKPDDARALFARIANEYPGSNFAPDAAFRRGFLLYEAGKFQDAATLWASSLAGASADQAQRLAYWQAKSLTRAGLKDQAKPILDQLTHDHEIDYFGARAISLLKGKADLPKSTREAKLDLAPVYDWTAAEAWLTQKVGRPVSDAGWSADPRWARAQELWLVGRTSQGDAEAFDLIDSYTRDPIALYTLARNLQQQGRVGMSARAGQRLLRNLQTNPNAGLPKALLSLSYPPAFGASAQKYSQNEKISPLLMLAFVRQESFFDPRAESSAGALGLTQLLPATAKTTAKKMGASEPSDEDLLESDLNLRYGASYMADQLKSFDNEIFVAFAAYNAGPNAAKGWRKASGSDADAFLEEVEFSESRLYVELVAENYAIYRYLYGGETEPDLPD